MNMKTRKQQLLSITKKHENMNDAKFMNILCICRSQSLYLQVHWFMQRQVKPMGLRDILRKEFDFITGKSKDYFA
jgi:hypothetical protein